MTILKRLGEDVALTRTGDDITVVYPGDNLVVTRTGNDLTIVYAGGTATAAEHIDWQWQSNLQTATGSQRWYADGDYVINVVRASVGTPSSGASVIVDVNIDGTTIFTTQGNRPTIAAGGYTATGTPDVTALSNGSYLTVDIDQIGSGTTGADLLVQIKLYPA